MTTLPLGDDAVTAYRLVMDEDGTASFGSFMSAWGALRNHPRPTPSDLPPIMTRVQDRLTVEGSFEPIVLTTDEVLAEAFRLSTLHAAPNDTGWHLHSNVVRAGKPLSNHTTMISGEGNPTTFPSFLRNHPFIETMRDRRDVLFVRPKPVALDIVDGKANIVVANAFCIMEHEPRKFGEFQSFGDARRTILRCPTGLVSHLTTIEMERAGEVLSVYYDAFSRRWRLHGGEFMKAIHPGEKPQHAYRNGHLVGGMVGYVTTNRNGRIHANAGRVVDSEGDEDALVSLVNRREAVDIAEAFRHLDERTDLDHVFTQPITVGSMGVWLSGLGDAEETAS